MSFEAEKDALFAAVSALGYVTAWPNVAISPTANHIRVNVLGSRSEAYSFGKDRLPSTLQIDCVVKEGGGELVAARMADAVQLAFAKDTVLTSGAVSVRIDREPYIRTAITFNGWYSIPVSIPFERFK